MRVQLKRSGGFAPIPGLSRPITIDGASLPAEDAAELARLVGAARFFDLPSVPSAPRPGAADYHQYTVTVEDQGRQHTVAFTDPVPNPELQALLAFLKRRSDAAGR
jgi:hypothetical protein